MATIKSALSLYDGMTGPLHSIHRALNIVLNSFEAVQTASKNAIDASAIADARGELAKAAAQFDTMEQNIRRARQEEERLNGSVRDGTNDARGLSDQFSRLKSIAAAVGVTAGIKKLAALSDQFAGTQARLALIAADGTDIQSRVSVDGAQRIEAAQQALDGLQEAAALPAAANMESRVSVNGTDGIKAAQQALNELQEAAAAAAESRFTIDGAQRIGTLQQELAGLQERAALPISAGIETSISVDTYSIDAALQKWDSLQESASAPVRTQMESRILMDGADNAAAVQQQFEGLQQRVTVPVPAETVRLADKDITALEPTRPRLPAAVRQPDALHQEISVAVTDGGSVAALEEKIMASAQRARASYFDTANAVASMGANARSAFASNDELIAFMEQVNKQFVLGGTSAQGQAAAMLQLTQAMGAGALRGEELNSILENAPGIARAIERYMGAAEGSIKSYAEQGRITADVVKNALFAAADETNRKFESMPMTWEQVWTSMQNTALMAFRPVLQRVNELANSEAAAQLTRGVQGALSALAGMAQGVVDILAAGADFVASHWDVIGPVIGGAAAALALYEGYLLAVQIAEAAAAAKKIVLCAAAYAHAAATGTEASAAAAATAAQYGLNTALLACPVTWIVAGIAAVITILYAAVGAWNHFSGESVSATGIIMGTVASLGAFIANTVGKIWNILIVFAEALGNMLVAVANFIGNVFTDPFGAVVRLFFDMADAVLGVLQSIAGAIDTVFGSNLAGAVQGWRDSLGGLVERTFGAGTVFEEKVDLSALKFRRFEYGSAWNTGYDIGSGIAEKVSGLSQTDGPVSSPLPAAAEVGGYLDNIYKNTGDTAAHTAETADALEYLDEDLQWMQDLAEREAVNRFTTAEIKIEQTNHNSIASDLDLDGIIDGLTAAVGEAVYATAEGAGTW